MSKITKKQLHNGWHCHDTEIIKMKKELRELKQSVLRLEKLTDEKLLDEPQLEQLDQSVFDGLDEKWRFAAIDEDGRAHKYEQRPDNSPYGEFLVNINEYGCDYELIGKGYDASNWQNSLIERDDIAKELLEVDLSSELTGSDLCRAMLARGDKYVSGFGHHHSDRLALESKFADTVSKHTQCFQSSQNAWDYFVPINNQGEPLTASEVGL